jgi:putative salt-induced outer membrane protein YdiY
MTPPVVSPVQRKLAGAGSVLIGLLGLTLTHVNAVAAQSDPPEEQEPAPPPPPPPPPPQLLSTAPSADTVKDKVSYGAPKEDALALNLSAGGAFAFGNTKVFQIAAGGDFRWIARPHSISANALFLWGQARPPGTDNMETTTNNLNARGKYEVFLSEYNSLFAAVGLRNDVFAGMKPRVNGQIGYGRYFVAEEKVRFWGEIGYDLMHTVYRPIPGAVDVADFPDQQTVHSARLFFGLEHQVHEYLSYVGGLEGFLNVEEPKAYRFVFDNAIRSTLSDSFKLEVKARFMYEAQPVVPDARKLDTALVVSLLYSVI